MTIGTTLPDGHRYRLDSRIATGGMGEVWRATDTLLGRPVALKLLKMEYADDPTFRTRFQTEARHAASLQHPGIAAVFDVGEVAADDRTGVRRPYLVMELVNGRPLSDLLRSGRALDPDAVRDLLAQAADALGAAHAAGIVHRDVKPANLLVTPDRRVKITDFGIARAADALGLTGTGQVMGTPQYLSPEQARGDAATPASDVYGLGVVAYECLAGRRPFEKESPVATALAHVNEPVPPLPDHVPADLARVVSRALAKDPAHRFADGRELAAALRDPSGVVGSATAPTVVAAAAGPPTRVLTGAVPGPVAPAPGPAAGTDERDGGRRSWLLVLLLLLLALLAALVLWQIVGGGEEGPRTPTTTPTQTTEQSPTEETEPTEQTQPTEQTTRPEQTEQATEEPQEITLDPDDYVDKDVERVVEDLRQLGLDPRTEEVENTGDESPGKVVSIEPTSGLVEGDTVTVRYWGEKPEDGGNEGEGGGDGNEGGGKGNEGNQGAGNGGQGEEGNEAAGLPVEMTTQGETT